MKAKAETTRQRLEALKVQLTKRKDLLRVLVAEKALKHQAKKAQLQENNLQVCRVKHGVVYSHLNMLDCNILTFAAIWRWCSIYMYDCVYKVYQYSL